MGKDKFHCNICMKVLNNTLNKKTEKPKQYSYLFDYKQSHSLALGHWNGEAEGDEVSRHAWSRRAW